MAASDEFDGLASQQAQAEADAGLDPGDLDATFAALIASGAVSDAWFPVTQLVTVEVESNLFSVEYTYENFMISAEYNASKTSFGSSTEHGEAYYVMTTYRFTDWFELGLYYSVQYPDKDDKDGKDIEAAGGIKEQAYLKDYALSTRFDVNEYWTVKLELHIMDGLYGVNFDESDNPADPDPDWTLFAAKMSFSF